MTSHSGTDALTVHIHLTRNLKLRLFPISEQIEIHGRIFFFSETHLTLRDRYLAIKDLIAKYEASKMWGVSFWVRLNI
jgi:hypothetical protein